MDQKVFIINISIILLRRIKMEEKISKETYIIKKLSKKIGELEEKIAELEFLILLMQQDNKEED